MSDVGQKATLQGDLHIPPYLQVQTSQKRESVSAKGQIPQSITSSARASNAGGTVRPSDLAVLRLITVSNFVGF
jgi:hypothetical protein